MSSNRRSKSVPTSNFFQQGGYERNPVAIRNNTVALLIAATDATMEEQAKLPGAQELLRELKASGHTVVLSSSAKDHEVGRYLELLQAREVVDDWTTSADVDSTKPDPDLVRAALDKAGTEDGVFVGDTVWDCEAAGKAGIPCIGVLSGGFGESELRGAGAAGVFADPKDLLEHLDATPLASR